MSRVVIFGLELNSALAHFYLRHDSEHEVVAFCVHRRYLPSPARFEGLPVVALEDVERELPPRECRFFVPTSPKRMNTVRASLYQEVKERGYRFVSYVSSRATVFPNVEIGENCFILEDNTLQPFVTIGDDVVLWSGNHIGHHSTIADHVFFSSHVVLSGRCVVESNCFFGVNATIRDGLRIAEGSCVAMGAMLTRDTEPWSLYVGAPAKKAEGSSLDVPI